MAKSWLVEGVKPMNRYIVQIEIPEGRVGEILDKLSAAQETIRLCYEELERLGVLAIKEKATSS